jgi:hypothetical protein
MGEGVDASQLPESKAQRLLVLEFELAGREEVLCTIQLRKVVAHKPEYLGSRGEYYNNYPKRMGL